MWLAIAIKLALIASARYQVSLTRSKSVSGDWEYEVMDGGRSGRHIAWLGRRSSDARRDAAVAQARLAEASVRYADTRMPVDIAAGVGSGRRSRAKPGEFAADELVTHAA